MEVLLKSGLYDWVQAAEVVSIAMEDGGAGTDREKRELSLRLIREVLGRGWMRIGDVDVNVPGAEGFTEWDLSIDDALDKVRREWNALGRLPELWELFWLANTEDGDRLAEKLYESDESQGGKGAGSV